MIISVDSLLVNTYNSSHTKQTSLLINLFKDFIMCHFTIELQEAVRSQANFLELLENKTPAFIRNFGADSAKVEEHLKTVAEYKIELIIRERKLEEQVASNNSVNLAEPSKLALLVNKAIDDINNLVKNDVIDNTLIAIAAHIRENKYSFNKQDSQVSDIVITHFINVFEKPVKVDNKEVIEVIEAVQYNINSYYVPFNRAELLSYITTIKHDDKEVMQAVRSHFLNIANKLK